MKKVQVLTTLIGNHGKQIAVTVRVLAALAGCSDIFPGSIISVISPFTIAFQACLSRKVGYYS